MTRMVGAGLVMLALAGCGASARSLPASLVQPADFPADLSPLKLPMEPRFWGMFPPMPSTSSVAYYEIIKGGVRANEVGMILVVRYPSTDDLTLAYQGVVNQMEAETIAPLTELGADGQVAAAWEQWPASDVVFRRCDTVVYVDLEGPAEPAIAIAKQIYARLPATCAAVGSE